MQIGEVRQQLTTDLFKLVDDILVSKQDYPVIYYIQIQINEGYKGPAAFNVGKIPTKDVDVSNKQCIGQRFVCFDCILRRIPKWEELDDDTQFHVCKIQCGFDNCPLNQPQKGCPVLEVDNKKGEYKWIILLPQDNYVDVEGDDIALIDESVKKTGVM